MNLKQCREYEGKFSEKASDVARKLAFAAIAIAWMFKEETEGGMIVPKRLVWPLAFAVVALAVDLAQYVFGATYWGLRTKQKEKELVIAAGTENERFDEERQFSIKRWHLRVLDGAFYGKLGLVFISYLLLLAYICGRLFS